MDFIIIFFRDILDGPLYTVIVIINLILICSCIGYLAENYLNRKKKMEKFNATYAAVDNSFVVGATTSQNNQNSNSNN